MINLLFSIIFSFTFAQSTTSIADKINTGQNKISLQEDETIYVIGSEEKAFYTPGSAHFVDQKELERFSYKDVSRVLDKVPGVYIQEEDGLGLRPNIGLRGAHPHRSKKITLMEDGILVGPAPYAAPAAYYFPTTSKISSMEVFKGPSSVKFGPNSVGGAINMVTRPFTTGSIVEVSSGTFNQIHAYSGGRNWLVEGVHKQGDLLKELDNGEEFDFYQNDFMMKYRTRLAGQNFSMKASFSNESSQETYLGTTNEDFNSAPFTRYRASQDDQLDWERYALQLSHGVSFNRSLRLNTSLYHHFMRRNWEKLNDLNFANTTLDTAADTASKSFRTVLRTGNDPRNLIGLLKGERDSEGAEEYLRIGANDRTYFSQGVQSVLSLTADTGSVAHNIDLGLRVHRDQVKRNHSEVLAAMVGGNLIYQDNSYYLTTTNQDTSNALAVFLQNEMIWGNLTAQIGARAERVEHERDPRDGGAIQENDESVFVPGVGVNYSLTDNLAILAGVNKGVTIVGPGQEEGIAPEEAINYELGFRIRAPVYLESVAFYSDYSNLKGSCTFSSGCDEDNLDREFNGGSAEVYGVESMVGTELFAGRWTFPLRLSHTFTVARFKSEIFNSNPEWGPVSGEEGRIIRPNDPLPYIPQNQVSFGTGVGYDRFSFDVNLLWKGQMADQAVAENREIIPSYGVIDTAMAYRYSDKGRAFLKVNNLLDSSYLVGFRPFGARPGAPRVIAAGFSQRF